LYEKGHILFLQDRMLHIETEMVYTNSSLSLKYNLDGKTFEMLGREFNTAMSLVFAVSVLEFCIL